MADTAVSAHQIFGAEQPSKRFTTGRVCVEPTCDTRLSIYNSGKHCFQHAPMSVPRTRGKKIA